VHSQKGRGERKSWENKAAGQKTRSTAGAQRDLLKEKMDAIRESELTAGSSKKKVVPRDKTDGKGKLCKHKNGDRYRKATPRGQNQRPRPKAECIAPLATI